MYDKLPSRILALHHTSPPYHCHFDFMLAQNPGLDRPHGRLVYSQRQLFFITECDRHPAAEMQVYPVEERDLTLVAEAVPHAARSFDQKRRRAHGRIR